MGHRVAKENRQRLEEQTKKEERMKGGVEEKKRRRETVPEIMLFIGKPKGRSRMISNATNPLK